MEEKKPESKVEIPEKKKKGIFGKLDKKKIQLIIAVALGAIVLLIYFSTLDFGKSKGTSAQPEYSVAEKNLEQVLSKIKGVGKISLVITYASGSETVYATDTESVTTTTTDGGKTVEVTESQSKVVMVGGKPVVIRVENPKILGVVIVCEGGGNPVVKMHVINATQTALNIGSNIIEVFSSN